ncbi:DUF3179 domain-containing protein [Cocleimonas sp. KMM 6892]|uniref:DUF3179 domain-containing protein n=1 Tax=unclassified Cocleimonas TaxID=2639732 RepID=UPI002DBDA1A8|nr:MULTISPECIES: DUF3179 domain-containing protein [unclassified Cocleimonas]MEB8433817.1 DUF3179 domain-containing protein [Cocleimonas sp. KMM 6892]MEC4716628.1 DUF3179 domain-containing protein [Cocleimonas sp. KMM 6895]MEC4746217.1 DUF3179 domain-containing protein [Cocleimonas sp. KMM 6896]
MRSKQTLYIVALLMAVLLSTSAHAKPVKNGFDLENSIILVDKILSGGPPRDGIPSIDKPAFLNADDVDYLKESDRVLGIVVGEKGDEEARAYPIKILNWHEIVNDEISGKAIAVTYCPLCGSGIVYDADFEGNAHKFGVSGLLYNSDVLLFDRETETLWSQILSKGVSGELVNKKLKVIQSAHTSWASWKKQYPDTKVLSNDTGFDRDYNRSPYGTYDNDVSVYFPVAFKSKRYHPKERVLGITINDKQKVYPFAELSKYFAETQQTSLIDRVDGQELTLEFDVENRDGTFKNANGEVVTSTNTFWFAWYAFHPKGEVYKFVKSAK